MYGNICLIHALGYGTIVYGVLGRQASHSLGKVYEAEGTAAMMLALFPGDAQQAYVGKSCIAYCFCPVDKHCVLWEEHVKCAR